MTTAGIDVDGILQAARQLTHLDDLGERDFLVGMRKLADSIAHEVRFSPDGQKAMTQRLVRIIANRLRFSADLARHPEILSVNLLPPVVILGLPRVGSTKLQRMLAASGSFQSPLFWQVFNPARMTEQPDSREDPRLEEARRYVCWRNSTNPAANAAHPIAVNEVEEETFLLEFSFETIYPMTFMNADGYYEWIQARDRSETYQYLASLLKYLQWQFHQADPKPWILKSPPNLGHEAQILKVAPGARFIMSHRDPVTIVASVAALVKQSRQLYCQTFDAHAIGRWCLREFSNAVRRHMAWRQAHPEIAVLDVAYSDVERNPMKIVRQSYDFLHLPLAPDVLQSIERWLSRDTHGQDLRHDYSLEACGLTADAIRQDFADYIRAFAAYL